MKVSVFVDQFTADTHLSVNRIYSLSNYAKPHVASASYKFDTGRALYLVGGRASIAEYCRNNPFRIEADGGGNLVMQMTRGVPGLSNKERTALGLKEEALLSKAVGVFKSKMLTFIQIKVGAANTNCLAMMQPHSDCIAEMIAFHEATLLDGMTDALGMQGGGTASAVARREAHNKKYASRGSWNHVPLPAIPTQRRYR